MNKTAIKGFAVRARQELLQGVAEKAFEQELSGLPHLDTLVEEAAYTWFNRLIALRYMEVNGLLPGGFRLFAEPGSTVRLAGVRTKELIHMCNRLSQGLPELFPLINEQTERLFPERILESGGLLERLLEEIPEEEWKQSVEMIGWLHQYYNTEQKDQAFEELFRDNRKISKERIPAVTQLFTPDWIVRYLVENSLGRLWMTRFPQSRLCGQWEYYAGEDRKNTHEGLDAAQQQTGREFLKTIHFMDPCMGSGHILLYAFDLLYQMYAECGTDAKEAVTSILRYNLFGLDIDERAYRMSYFTLMMKAQQYAPDLWKSGLIPHVYTVADSRFMDEAFVDFVAGNDVECRAKLLLVQEIFRDAKELGSLLKFPDISLECLKVRMEEIEDTFYDNVMDALMAQKAERYLNPLLRLWDVMTAKYEVVVTNPPYMGKSNMDKKLRAYVKSQYPLSNHDLFAVFIEKCGELLAKGGYQAMITQHSWMFLERYRALRRRLLSTRAILHMIHLGAHAFEEITGEVVQTTAWIMQENEEPHGKGDYVRLVEYANEKERIYLEELRERRHKITYQSGVERFERIPGTPVAYWVSEAFLTNFERTNVADVATVTNGMFTCDNKRFLKYWFEVPADEIFFDCHSKQESLASNRKWYPYNKGGSYRRWYGNQEYVINFAHFGEEVREYRVHSGQAQSFPGQDYYFRPSLSWSLVSPDKFGIRYYPAGFVFDIAGSSVFPKQEEHLLPLLGMMAGEPALYALKILNPTINYQAGDVRMLPVAEPLLEDSRLAGWVEENIAIAKADWDSFETSWNFKRHPLCEGETLSGALESRRQVLSDRQMRMWRNERQINQLLCAAYHLEEEPVFKKNSGRTGADAMETGGLTIAQIDDRRDLESLLSYLTGCAFGRYSLEKEGLCFAGQKRYDGPETPVAFGQAVSVEELADLLCVFLETLYGKAALPGTLRVFAEALGWKDADLRDGLVRYLKKGFYQTHLRVYHKHPIYKPVKDGQHICGYSYIWTRG